MSKVQLFEKAPEIALNDFNGIPVNLSDYLNKKNVVLVFNRGFF